MTVLLAWSLSGYNVDEMVTQVLTQLVEDGGDEDRMSVVLILSSGMLNLLSRKPGFHPSISAQWHSGHLSTRHKHLFPRQNSQFTAYARSQWPKDIHRFSAHLACAEESTLGVSLNAQAQAPDIPAGIANGKATRFRRAPDCTESLNDLAPAAGSSPCRLTSVPPTYVDDTLTKLVGKWFRQIIPLGIWHTFSLGTYVIPILQAPRF
jgi:hypothetical protein